MSQIIVGDCRNVFASLPKNSFDVCITDPPYELGFMGKSWDRSGVAFDAATWTGVLDLLKPGAYMLAFGGTRTYHRLTCAIEDAGFEIHDCISWLYGSGFPKHKSKLKPAWEPIVVARKPGEQATPLQIDACRIETSDTLTGSGSPPLKYGGQNSRPFHENAIPRGCNQHEGGRWPANVILDEEAAAQLDAQTGTLTSGANPTRRGSPKTRNTYGAFEGQEECVAHRGADSGGASRFYYCAKASRAEREFGLEMRTRKPLNWSSGTQSPGTFQSAGTDKASSNPHPTVKPLALMRWLVRLATPRGGAVLEPFGGSGTTALACIHERMQCVAIEKELEFAHIAKGRCDAIEPGAFTLELMAAA